MGYLKAQRGKGFKSPEEHGKGHPPLKRGSAGPFDSGFGEGEHGRGPSPYNRKMSPKYNGHSREAHAGNAGRGGAGVIGKGDAFKGRSEDIAHPKTHAEFEALGTGK